MNTMTCIILNIYLRQKAQAKKQCKKICRGESDVRTH